jgi:organic radical activating enzyme
MKYKINEIFYSIQGEGANVGLPAIFIRFANCNLECSFCDTEFLTYTEMTKEEIQQECYKYETSFIILTGGEPCLQIDEALLEVLKGSLFQIYLETNGTIDISEIDYYFNWITVSPKIDSEIKINRVNEVKVVYEGDKTDSFLGELRRRFKSKTNLFYLQPCSMKNIKETIQKVKENPEWRLSIQIQKLIDIK